MMLKLFGFWIKTAFLFLFRSARSTVVLSLMVVVAVSALIFLSVLTVGINDTMIRNSVSLFAGHISGYYLPASLQTKNLLVDGVTDVLKHVSMRGILSRGDQVETVTLIGLNPSEEKKCTALWEKTIQGKYLQRGEKAGFISQELAETLNVKPGNTLKFQPTFAEDPFQLTISGIYKTGIDLTALTSHNRYFTVSGVVYPRLTFYSLWLPPIIAFQFCLLSAIWPAVLVNRKKAADVLRIV